MTLYHHVTRNSPDGDVILEFRPGDLTLPPYVTFTMPLREAETLAEHLATQAERGRHIKALIEREGA